MKSYVEESEDILVNYSSVWANIKIPELKFWGLFSPLLMADELLTWNPPLAMGPPSLEQKSNELEGA